jgi:hypothetical protein
LGRTSSPPLASTRCRSIAARQRPRALLRSPARSGCMPKRPGGLRQSVVGNQQACAGEASARACAGDQPLAAMMPGDAMAALRTPQGAVRKGAAKGLLDAGTDRSRGHVGFKRRPRCFCWTGCGASCAVGEVSGGVRAPSSRGDGPSWAGSRESRIVPRARPRNLRAAAASVGRAGVTRLPALRSLRAWLSTVPLRWVRSGPPGRFLLQGARPLPKLRCAS